MASLKPEDVPISVDGMRVAIATPCYGGMLSSTYVQSLAFTIPVMMSHGISFDILQIPNESIISKARNLLVKTFLDGEGTHLWFIDADMGWDPFKVMRLLASGKEIVAAAGPRKQMPLSFATLLSNPIEICKNTGLVKAVSVGTGCMLISRRALEHMIDNDPDNWYLDYATKDKIPNLFDFQLHKHNFWSEDYTFCNKWRTLGGEVWVDPEFELEHVGQHTFKGALKDILAPMGAYFVQPDQMASGGINETR